MAALAAHCDGCRIMAADTFSNFIGMTLQGTGNNNNNWGAVLNGSTLLPLERAIRGNIVRAVTGGTLDLSANPPPAAVSQVLDFAQIFSGALTQNQIVILPNISGLWRFINITTGPFQLLLQLPGGPFINIPNQTGKLVACDGIGDLVRQDRDQVGNFEYNAVLNAGTLAANGASVLKADFPDLYLKYGTTFGTADSTHFTLPKLTDTGRFLRSTTSTLTVGTYQANQNAAHTHSVSGTTSNESAFHTHSGTSVTSTMNSSADHTHNYTAPSGSGGVAAGTNPVPIQTVTSTTTNANIDHTHNFTFTTGNESVQHTHSFSATTTSQGGTEARPESLAVIISIRY